VRINHPAHGPCMNWPGGMRGADWHGCSAQLEEEKKDYAEAVKAGPKYGPGEEVELGMQVVLVHGDEVIADSAVDGSFQAACKKFKGWVQKAYPMPA
jgi:hypothetical protein